VTICHQSREKAASGHSGSEQKAAKELFEVRRSRVWRPLVTSVEFGPLIQLGFLTICQHDRPLALGRTPSPSQAAGNG
jgi:hypothetical protein